MTSFLTSERVNTPDHPPMQEARQLESVAAVSASDNADAPWTPQSREDAYRRAVIAMRAWLNRYLITRKECDRLNWLHALSIVQRINRSAT